MYVVENVYVSEIKRKLLETSFKSWVTSIKNWNIADFFVLRICLGNVTSQVPNPGWVVIFRLRRAAVFQISNIFILQLLLIIEEMIAF